MIGDRTENSIGGHDHSMSTEKTPQAGRNHGTSEPLPRGDRQTKKRVAQTHDWSDGSFPGVSLS
jgi:hypothetical protein